MNKSLWFEVEKKDNKIFLYLEDRHFEYKEISAILSVIEKYIRMLRKQKVSIDSLA
jgi:hypothetical protein